MKFKNSYFLIVFTLLIAVYLVDCSEKLKKKTSKSGLSKRSGSKTKKKAKAKSKWFSAGTRWNDGNTAYDQPGEVVAPFVNAGYDQAGQYIDNNYWKTSDLHPWNQHNGSPRVIGNRHYLYYKHKQPDETQTYNKANYGSNYAQNFRKKQGGKEEDYGGSDKMITHVGRSSGPL